MIRIRTGAAWRHDPGLRAALRGGAGAARAAAARAVVDAVALEVDGVDVAAGLAEGPLLPTLEALLRAVARVVAGAPHATVPFPDGEVELLIRRHGRAALLTVVSLGRPSRVVARDVEVELDALAAAALDASAALCRDLAELLPGAEAREARPLRAAARALRRTDRTVDWHLRAPAGAEDVRPSSATVGHPAARSPVARRGEDISCTLDVPDEEALLAAYEGGRPDLGSLLGHGRVALRAGGREVCALPGIPFLVVRDLGGAVDGIIRAVRAREPRCTVALGRLAHGATLAAEVDLARGTIALPGAGVLAFSALALAQALAEAQLELAREARSRNPRQAENAYVAELERGAAERLAQLAELAEGDRPAEAPIPTRAGRPRPVPQRPLGPGRLRRLAFRRTFRVEVGAPAGEGLFVAGGVATLAGASATAAVARATGALLWRAEGCAFAAAAGGALVVARGGTLAALSPRTGRLRWARPLPGAPPTAAVALARGPVILVERGAATGLDPSSGRTLWRFEPPGAARLSAAGFGGVLVAGADTGILYGLDAAGRVLWRLAAPGPITRPPLASAGLCLSLSAADPGTALLAVDPASGARRWEAPLDVAPGAAPCAWGRRIAVAGTVGGDPIVIALERSGASAWTVAPTLDGPVAAAAAGALLVVRDAAGALAAIRRDGSTAWSRPAPAGQSAPGGPPPAIARGTVIAAAADGLQALDARSGELVGAIAAAPPARLAVDASLAVAAIDPDGQATGWRVGTHLSLL
jgi:outer membrane protein assembly factor BamB